jgi:predicted O-methyltransferase YrrM
MSELETAPSAADAATTTSVKTPGEIAAESDEAVWRAAALVIALRGSADPVYQRSAAEVLATVGVVVDQDDAGRINLAGQVAAPLLQAAALLNGATSLWSDQPDQALIAQGRASAQGARAFVDLIAPRLEGLTEALNQPGVKMLDVGTGIGALAVAYAELMPQLHVVGIDVLPRVLALAASTVSESTCADRVELRQQSVADLDDVQEYSLIWMPAPFLPEKALRLGLDRAVRALRPGGWIMVGHAKIQGSDSDNALTRFKTVAFGGTALDNAQAQALLIGAGLINVTTLPTPAGAPAITVGRRPTT